MENTTICLIDDHEIVRNGLKELLNKISDFKVVHEFSSGTAFLAALPLDPAPDVYILDYSMPGLDGIEVLKELENRDEEHRVMLLTQHFDEKIIDTAYRFGARGFMHKNCTASQLEESIGKIKTVGYDNISDILRRIRRYDQTPQKDSNPIKLSDRESEFLRLVCDPAEYTYDQMASIMNLSVKSIEAYRSALFDRYNIKSKVGLVLFSYTYKLTPPFSE